MENLSTVVDAITATPEDLMTAMAERMAQMEALLASVAKENADLKAAEAARKRIAELDSKIGLRTDSKGRGWIYVNARGSSKGTLRANPEFFAALMEYASDIRQFMADNNVKFLIDYSDAELESVKNNRAKAPEADDSDSSKGATATPARSTESAASAAARAFGR